MSTDTAENSAYGGTPIQLFDFTMGARTYRYVAGTPDPVEIEFDQYRPDPGVALGRVEQALAESPPTVEITISQDSEVAQLYIPYMPPEPMFVMVRRNHYELAPGEYAPEFIGEVVSSMFSSETGVCTLTCKMNASAMARRVPWPVYGSMCTYVLFGVGCEKPRAPYETSMQIASGEGTVTLVSNDFATAGAGNPHQDAWFRNGRIRHVVTNEVRMIAGHSGNTIYLQTPFTSLRNGDEVVALPGCNRQYVHCDEKFDNLDNAMMFPWVPTRNPYTQNVFGTGNTPRNAKSKTNWRKAINPAGWNGSWGLF